jgi:hypothetical protein
VENVILTVASMAFIPVFFFASTYGQIALAGQATTSSLLILYFFIGFVIFAQIGGRMLDGIGAKRPVVIGCVLLGQANTDAINRASRVSYGEAAGITQTVRSYGAGLGFAILGTILISEFRSNITNSLIAQGVPAPAAAGQASQAAQLQGGSGSIASIPSFIRAEFASATRDVLIGMGVRRRPRPGQKWPASTGAGIRPGTATEPCCQPLYDQTFRYLTATVAGELSEFSGGPPITCWTALMFGVTPVVM